MMAHSVSFIVLVAALIINTFSHCSAENVYCVTPNATSCSSCPHNSTHCDTLSEYAQEAELYFTSNTTMVLLPGDHVLDRNITVANVTKLTMCRESSSDNIATFVRNGSVGFSFTNMVDFNIYSLAFTSYNKSWSYGSRPASNSALFLQSTKSAKLVNCSFHDNLGPALTVHNTSITLAENKFTHNQCGCESSGYNCNLGCGITALNSTLTFTGNTTFHENNASYCDVTGAIWASASSLDFDGTNNFIGNSAECYGGAIHAKSKSSLSFNGTSTFSHNSAYEGGAIYTDGIVMLTFNGTNNLSHNSADMYGGAIHAETNSSLSFIGTSDFSHNSADFEGGAIDAYNNVVLTFTGASNFSSNIAEQGGAISAYINTALLFDGRISFVNNGRDELNMNRDSYGGALYLVFGATFSIAHDITVYWENNHASFGGAISVRNINNFIYCTRIANFIPPPKCFFQLQGQNLSNASNPNFIFNNNSADTAGNVLFGGAVDN